MRAIDADVLKDYFFRPYSNEETYSNIDIERIINAQPTIEPERKMGRWVAPVPRGSVIMYSQAYWECDQCQKVTYLGNKMQFCPNCGAMNSESLKAAEIGKEVARGLKSGVRGEKNEV